ncbi:MAG: AraC family transcriptional regulator [Candidatus Izemoplasmatales bacterium]|nr:AraC family transcriptional regulator [Candidatus Izemoplasmatales bacterium]
MDWLDRMNTVLDYIEDHLTEAIDYEQMAKMSLCSGNLFQRMFSNFTGMSISEYIRRRKLSKAGMDLASGDTQVIDIAGRYGYDSPDAFAYAFKRLHGITPSQAKIKGTTLTNYPRLTFTMKIKGEEKMRYRIVERQEFKVAGKSIKTSQEENMKQNSIPKFWDLCKHNGTMSALCAVGLEKPFLGVCYGDASDGSFLYMVGVEAKIMQAGFEMISIPQATWAVFESKGPMPFAIQKVWKEIFQNFLPTSKYDHAPMADFELYPEGDNQSQEYRCEVWIPVVPKRL